MHATVYTHMCDPLELQAVRQYSLGLRKLEHRCAIYEPPTGVQMELASVRYVRIVLDGGGRQVWLENLAVVFKRFSLAPAPPPLPPPPGNRTAADAFEEQTETVIWSAGIAIGLILLAALACVLFVCLKCAPINL